MTVYGIGRIKNTIPHRGEILLVDRAADVVPGESLTAYKAVSGNEPCYASLGQDAAASDYAYPTSLVIESWAQSAVLLSVWENPNPDVLAGKVELAGAINEVSFSGRAYPGDVLEHRVRLVKSVDETAVLAGETYAGGREVLRVGAFVVALRDVNELLPAPDRAPVSV
ncbi:3-hydroxyacyl-[acyl-carrier-protein] dehydratase [Streptomyces umbrinus]|uniref:3-hydroxyacyl-[acyl-carrier-protein] dehydratase n=1 Tax=Streptomyces umbrinus TaxID=67370 RepID=A0ABU0STX9_9ACTN|nr:3-hydroxyacyl-ACP dehydratase [Streptomyces umbrinus]MDQ1026952.1 3-hydroxyacyl-[acyl-carrier-protein] dehydratase [Streptomyces umbrinus]